jgi:hypothetical protein
MVLNVGMFQVGSEEHSKGFLPLLDAPVVPLEPDQLAETINDLLL